MDSDAIRKLLEAILTNDGHKIKSLIIKGFNPDSWIPANQQAKRYKEISSLMFAAENNCLNVVNVLIAAKCNVNLQHKHYHMNDTALHLACSKGHIQIVKRLIEAGSNVNIKNKENHSPLHYACQTENVEVVRLLLEKGAMLDSSDFQRSTPLMVACLWNNLPVANFLIQAGCNVNATNPVGLTCLNHMFMPDENPNMNLLMLLIKSGIKLKVHDSDDEFTPLVWVCRNSEPEIVVLVYGIVSNLISDAYMYKLLHYASFNKNIGIAQFLLQKGANPNFCNVNDWYDPPIIIASQSGFTGLIELLVKFKSRVDQTDRRGSTALHHACLYNNFKVIQLLINRGADINKQNVLGNTPLHEACRKGYSKVVQILLKNKCNVEIKNINSHTPLFMACQNGHIECVQLLLKAGSSWNNFWRTSLFKINLEQQKSVIQILKYRPYLINTEISFLLLDAGYDLSQDYSIQPIEDYLLSFSREMLEDNNDFFKLLIQLGSSPISLKQLCCNRIQTILGQNLRQQILTINIPNILRTHLCRDYLK